MPTRARRWCDTPHLQGECRISKIRRTVWDGDREFYEIQMPGGDYSAHLERDVGTVNEPLDTSDSPAIDPSPFFGRVAYTHGHGIDRPLSIVRMGYEDLLDSDGVYVGHWTAAPFAIFPLWNSRGQGDLGVFVNGEIGYCVATKRCIRISWPGTWFDMARPKVTRNAWHGSLLEDKEDATGTLYRRNRSYDPRTGQFTQEDPIGLAGGLNSYGFAAGDPVNYSDPYGLCPKKAEEGSVCLDFYIAAKRAGPLKGDHRGTDPNAPASKSRIQVVANRGGAITYRSASGTCRVTGGCSAPRSFSPGENEVSSTAHGDGSFTVSINARAAIPAVPKQLVPAISGHVTFTPDGAGGYQTSGNRDAMPTLDIFQRVDGQWVQLPGDQGHRPERGGVFLVPLAPNDRW